MQEVVAQTGYNSQNLWLHFGLNQSSIIDSVIIKWPSGHIDNCSNIPADNFYIFTEDLCLQTGISEVSNKNNFNISVTPNPFNQQASVFYSIPQQSNVMISLYNLNWKKVKTVLNEKQNAGFHGMNILFPELNPGIYFLEIRTDNFSEIKKIIH